MENDAPSSVNEWGAKRLSTLPKSRAPIAWCEEQNLLVTSTPTYDIAVWDGETGAQIHRHEIDIRAQSFSCRSGLLAVLEDRRLSILDIHTGTIQSSIELDPEGILDTHWPESNIEWSPDGNTISVTLRGSTLLVDTPSLTIDRQLRYQDGGDPHLIVRTSWSSDSLQIAAASYNAHSWNVASNTESRYDYGQGLYDVAWSPDTESRWLAGASSAQTVVIWDTKNGRKVNVLEGHTDHVRRVAFSNDGKFLFSTSSGEVRVWLCEGWRPAAMARAGRPNELSISPNTSRFALCSSRGSIQLWGYNPSKLIADALAADSVAYTTAKIVLVGESGVGKTGLGWRIANGTFKEHSSTHGQQFWLVDSLSMTRADGAVCEAILWDLAGQPDYRLIHALFLDDADLALIVCDPTHPDSPVQGVDFWLKQLRVSPGMQADENDVPPAVLVAGRCDRGTARITDGELASFCKSSGIAEVFYTSALRGDGIEELISWMRGAIAWDNKPATVTTGTFKRIKDYVLNLKENRTAEGKIIYSIAELSKLFGAFETKLIDDHDVITAVRHLSNHGYVSILRTSKSEVRVLLLPELLNNLAASFVLEARRNPRGLGSLSERTLLSASYVFPEIQGLVDSDKETMLDSTVAMFLSHNICFREIDPLNKISYIVFPELINLRKPPTPDAEPIDDDVLYTVSGAVENVYASLVVLLGYTNTFTRTAQWRGHARYEVGDGLICGFRLEDDRAGDQDFVLYFGRSVGDQVRSLFKSLFESFLSRHEVVVKRFEPATCNRGHRLNRGVAKELGEQGIRFAHCPICSDRIELPDATAPTQLTAPQAAVLQSQQRAADLRSKFEEALFRLSAFAAEQRVTPPTCFISYAWGDTNHERWIERRLARDLLSAGVDVVLDRWENGQIGSSIPRFVERAQTSNKVLVVGTPPYRNKYLNMNPTRGSVVAAEGDIIGMRMIGTEASKLNILPLIRSGAENTALPDILRGRVYADFRKEDDYFTSFLDVVLSIYEIPPRHDLALELREKIQPSFS